MALVVNDRVKETSTTTGTGTLTLDGAVTGFETFSSAIGNTNTTYYAIELPNTAEFEVGLGTVSAGQLARTTVISSSNSDALVNFSAGTKNVFCTLPASKATVKDADGRVGIGKATPTAALEIGGDGDTNLQSFRVNASTNSEWFSVGVGGAGVVRFNSQGGNTRVGGAMDLGARMNIAQLSASSAALALAGGYANNILEVNSANSNLGGDVMVIDQNGLVGIGTTSPSNKLHVKSDDTSTAPQLLIEQDGTGDPVLGFKITDAGTSFSMGLNNSDGDKFLIAANGTDIGNSPILALTTGGNVGIGTSSPSAQLHITGSDTSDQVIFENTDAGTGTAPDLVFYRNSASPAVNDLLGRIDFRGKNDGGTSIDYGFIYGVIEDETAGTEDGALWFNLEKNGSVIQPLKLKSNENVFNDNGEDINFRIESNNDANIFFVDAGNDRIGIGTASPGSLLHLAPSTFDGIHLDGTAGTFIRVDRGFPTNDATVNFQTAGTTNFAIGLDNNNTNNFYIGDVNLTNKYVTITETSGNVGIGTSSPSTLLHLSSSDPQITITDTDGTGSQVIKAVGDDLVLDSPSNIKFDADSAGNVWFMDGGTTFLKIYKFGGTKIEANVADEDLIFKVNDGGSFIDVLTFDSSEAGAATFNSDVTVGANLDVSSGTIKLDGNYPTGTDNVALGDTALDDGSLSGASNTAIGSKSLTANTTGASNTAVGLATLFTNTTGSNNVAIGINSLKLHTTSNTTAVGASAMAANTTGSENTAVGYLALTTNSTGSQNTAIGREALEKYTAGGATAVGFQALEENTTGVSNTAVGYLSFSSMTTGARNVGIGYAVGQNSNTSNSTYVGYRTGLNASGVQNTFIGYESGTQAGGQLNTYVGTSAGGSGSGDNNVAVGRSAGTVISGDDNVLVGESSGGIVSGNNNIIIGANSAPSASNANNEITLGDANITSLRIPGLASGASSGDVLTYDGTDITLSAPTGVSAGFAVAMAIAL